MRLGQAAWDVGGREAVRLKYKSHKFPRGTKPLAKEGETAMQLQRRRLGPADCKIRTKWDHYHRIVIGMSLADIMTELPAAVRRVRKPCTGEDCSFYCINTRQFLHGKVVSEEKRKSVTYCVIETNRGALHYITSRGLFAAYSP
jgi:hypothetical protein